MRIFLVVISMALAYGPAARAAPDPAEIQCGSKFSSAADIERCLADALAQAEQALAQAQEQLNKSLRLAQPRFKGLQDQTLAAMNDALRVAQDAWKEFKEKQCKYQRELHSAIGEDALEYTACALKLVRDRTGELLDEARFWAEKFPAREPAKP